MNEFGDRHEKRIKIYKDLLRTLPFDREMLQEVTRKEGCRPEVPSTPDRLLPDLKSITLDDMDHTLREALYGADVPKKPDAEVVTPEITEKPKMQGRKVEI